MMPQQPIYTPPHPIPITNISRFTAHLNTTLSISPPLKSYDDLHRFSITDLNAFWLNFWSFANIKASIPLTHAISNDASITSIPKFFDGARLNYAENLLFNAAAVDDAVAMTEIDESILSNRRQPRRYTWHDLRRIVARYAGVLTRSGVTDGDAVVAIGGQLRAFVGILARFSCSWSDIREFRTRYWRESSEG